jgi:hypothetical protein
MLTPTQTLQLQQLLDDPSTPHSVRELLLLLVDSTQAVFTSIHRVEYLQGIITPILNDDYSPADLLTFSYTCPNSPKLMPIDTDPPLDDPSLQKALHLMALELGTSLLTPMEAQAFLKGIYVGLGKDSTQLLSIISSIIIGQRIKDSLYGTITDDNSTRY